MWQAPSPRARLSLAAAIAALAPAAGVHADVEVRHNVAFTAVNQNPWTGGPAFHHEWEYRKLRFDFRADLPDLEDPTGVVIGVVEETLGVDLPIDPGLKAGGSVSGHFGLNFGYYVSGGRLNINYPAVAVLRIETNGPNDTVTTGRPFTITSAFLPGTERREIPFRTSALAAGAGYEAGRTSIPGFELEVFSQPHFSTYFPNAAAWATADWDVRAGVFLEADYLFDTARKEFLFGDGPREVPLVSVSPAGIQVPGFEPVDLFQQTFVIPGGGYVEVSYPDVRVDSRPAAPGGVLHGFAQKPILSLQADFDKIVPVVGAVLSNRIGPIGYSLLSTDGGPVLSLYQEMTFTPRPRVQLGFHEVVLARGESGVFHPTMLVEFGLGESVVIQPLVGSLEELRIRPTYLLENHFQNETGLSLGVVFHLQVLDVETPLGDLGPAADETLPLDGLVRVPLFREPAFPIGLGAVTADDVVVPKSSQFLGEFPRSKLLQQGARFVGEDPGSGRVTYQLRFVRTPGEDPLDAGDTFEVEVAGRAQRLEQCVGEFCETFATLIYLDEPVVLHDAAGVPVAELGEALCVGCESHPFALSPVSPFVTDELGRGIYLTDLSEFPDGLIDVEADPILSQALLVELPTPTPPVSLPTTLRSIVSVDDTLGPRDRFGRPSLNNRDQTAFTAVTDTGAQGAFRADSSGVSAIADNTARFASLAPEEVAINDGGAVAFGAAEGPYRDGVFLGDGGSVIAIAEPGGPVGPPSVDDGGTVVFRVRLESGDTAIYASDGGPPRLIATTVDTPFSELGEPSINNVGQVAFRTLEEEGAVESVWIADGAGLTRIADTTGALSGFHGPVEVNDSGVVAFQAGLDDGGSAIYVAEGGSLTAIADTAGRFRGFNGFGSGVGLNAEGAVAFVGELDGGGGGLYLVARGLLEEVARLGDPLFGSTLTALGFSRALNDRGDLAFWYALADGRSGIALATLRPVPPAAKTEVAARPD